MLSQVLGRINIYHKTNPSTLPSMKYNINTAVHLCIFHKMRSSYATFSLSLSSLPHTQKEVEPYLILEVMI